MIAKMKKGMKELEKDKNNTRKKGKKENIRTVEEIDEKER